MNVRIKNLHWISADWSLDGVKDLTDCFDATNLVYFSDFLLIQLLVPKCCESSTFWPKCKFNTLTFCVPKLPVIRLMTQITIIFGVETIKTIQRSKNKLQTFTICMNNTNKLRQHNDSQRYKKERVAYKCYKGCNSLCCWSWTHYVMK